MSSTRSVGRVLLSILLPTPTRSTSLPLRLKHLRARTTQKRTSDTHRMLKNGEGGFHFILLVFCVFWAFHSPRIYSYHLVSISICESCPMHTCSNILSLEIQVRERDRQTSKQANKQTNNKERERERKRKRERPNVQQRFDEQQTTTTTNMTTHSGFVVVSPSTSLHLYIYIYIYIRSRTFTHTHTQNTLYLYERNPNYCARTTHTHTHTGSLSNLVVVFWVVCGSLCVFFFHFCRFCSTITTTCYFSLSLDH